MKKKRTIRKPAPRAAGNPGVAASKTHAGKKSAAIRARKSSPREPVANRSAPCDCEANAELGFTMKRFASRRSTATFSTAMSSSSIWRVAKSLLRLRDQVNARAPGRDKSSDGTIGDTSHQNRNSDHNPWVDEGVVTAMDITHDPANGCDADGLAEAIRAARDSRVKYLIWNRRICNHAAIGSAEPWAWRPYNGSNPHDQHLHISVKSSQASYDDESDWPV